MDGSNWRRVDVSSNNGRRRRHRTGPATLHHPHRLARGLPPTPGIECYMHSIVTFFGFLRLPRFPLGPLTPTFTIPIDTYIVSPYTYIYSPNLRASCSIFIPTQDPAITSLRTTQALDEREFLPCAMAVLRVLLTPLSRSRSTPPQLNGEQVDERTVRNVDIRPRHIRTPKCRMENYVGGRFGGCSLRSVSFLNNENVYVSEPLNGAYLLLANFGAQQLLLLLLLVLT